LVHECRPNVQLAMFSATMKQSLQAVIEEVFPEKPLHIKTRGSNKMVPTLKTVNRIVDDGRRVDVLRKVLREDPQVGTLLFANTRAQCDQVAEWLDAENIPYVKYIGQMDRRERRLNLIKFRDGEVAIMLTTDLGGRGLDIERVDRVVNVHLPQDADNYLHRVGRTARAGRKGLVVNLVTERDQPLMNRLKERAYSPS
jgi:ATP-dependent RNA helicase RhlE